MKFVHTRGVHLIHFHWMCAYWSAPPLVFRELIRRMDNGDGFDLYSMGARELSCRPRGAFYRFGRLAKWVGLKDGEAPPIATH